MEEGKKLQLLKPTANAIFNIAKELGMIKEIYEELYECSKLFQDTEIKKYFFDKLILKKNKKELIEKRLKPLLSKETYTFVSILTEHDSIDALPDIVSLYKEIAYDYSSIVRVRIITASPIDNKTAEDIVQTVKCFSDNKISYEAIVDESIIGGIIVYVGSMVYDYSIKRQIDLMQNKFNYEN